MLAAREPCRKVIGMPRARKHLVCVADTPYYHVTMRCVRRAFLCGTDKVSGQCFEHRRGWIEERIRILSSVFSINICAFAIMSNHYHLVVKLISQAPSAWSDEEVLKRWTTLYRGPLLVQQARAGKNLSVAEWETLASIVTVYRARLGSLSWFMKCLNEPVARRANAEDDCTGHFWEARFHSQALMSEKALFTAMAYVDLNPVRAGMAKTPKDAEYTSLKARVDKGDTESIRAAILRMIESGEVNHFDLALRPLMPFSGNSADGDNDALPMREVEYLKLVDTTARDIVYGKRGRINPGLVSILERLGLSLDQWIDSSSKFRQYYRAGDLRISSIG